MKKPLPIDALIRWAWRDELPKEHATLATPRPAGFGGPWGSITKAGVLGTDVQEPDIRNRYGVVPDMTAQAEPHPDAVLIWNSASEVGARLEPIFSPDWNPLSDMPDLGVDGAAAVAKAVGAVSLVTPDGRRHLKAMHEPPTLIHRAAILGPPQWEYEAPVRHQVRRFDGRVAYYVTEWIETEAGSFEIEVDGWDQSRRIPKPGAYTKTYLDPDPVEAAISRTDYALWHAALCAVQEAVGASLSDHVALPPSVPPRPWDSGAPEPPRILRDKITVAPIIEPTQRPYAGPPPDRTPESIKAANAVRRKARQARSHRTP